MINILLSVKQTDLMLKWLINDYVDCRRISAVFFMKRRV